MRRLGTTFLGALALAGAVGLAFCPTADSRAAPEAVKPDNGPTRPLVYHGGGVGGQPKPMKVKEEALKALKGKPRLLTKTEKLKLLKGGLPHLPEKSASSCNTVMTLTPAAPTAGADKGSLVFLDTTEVSSWGVGGFAYFDAATWGPEVQLWFTPAKKGQRYLIDFMVLTGNGGASQAYNLFAPGNFHETVKGFSPNTYGHITILFDAADTKLHEFRLAADAKTTWWSFLACEVTALEQ